MRTRKKFKDLLAAALHSSLLLGTILTAGMTISAQAATQAPIVGEIMSISVDNPADVYSRGIITIGGQNVIIPANMVIDLPANRLTLQQFFTQAPPDCLLTGETGLAKADVCNTSMTGAIATILANRTNAGNVIAGEVMIEKATESVLGTVTYIDYTDGYLRVNGTPGDATTGTMIRINDPQGRFTVQQGLGVAAGNTSNGSADPRYGVDPDNYTATFSTGYPACIPSTVTGIDNRTVGADPITGAGDPFCPDTNRTANNIPADAFRFAPIQLNDHIAAEGNFEIINGVQFLSAHTLVVHQAILTVDGQPDYLIFDEVEWDVAGFNNERVRTLFIGFSSRGDTLVDIFALHIDPETGQETEHVIASTIGCDAIGGAGSCTAQGIGATAPGIFKVRYDVDFLVAQNKPELLPCSVLGASNLAQIGHTNPCSGNTLAQNFKVLSPISRDLIGRSRNKVIGNNGGPFPDGFDIRGNAAPNGEYLNPVGIGHPEFVEVNLNAIQTPFIFAGQPWNLDRRLGPGGSEGANPGSAQPLDPFPYSGLDPRTQAGTSLNVLFGTTIANRIFAFVTNPGANDGVLGGTLAWPPADPPAEAITVAPVVELACPLVPDGFVEVLKVSRADYRAGVLPGQPLVIIATTSGGSGLTLTANWGTGSGNLQFVDFLASGKARYRGIFRRLAVPPGPNVTITSNLGTIATSAITTVAP